MIPFLTKPSIFFFFSIPPLCGYTIHNQFMKFFLNWILMTTVILSFILGNMFLFSNTEGPSLVDLLIEGKFIEIEIIEIYFWKKEFIYYKSEKHI